MARAADLLPSVTMPKPGGAIRSLTEKFSVSAATGTARLTVDLPFSPGRSGQSPALQLSYDSGAGNGPLGFGWSLGLQAITRKTDKGLPRYLDEEESDCYLLAGADDLVPVLEAGARKVISRTVHGTLYSIAYYRPRTEGLYSRIERWTAAGTGTIHWRVISRDNVTALYGAEPESRVANPADPSQVYSWQLSRTWDDKGNLTCYSYLREDDSGIDVTAAHEANRTTAVRSAQVYLAAIRYGNVQPWRPDWTAQAEPALPADWLFTVVADYGDHGSEPPVPQPDRPWPVRPDPFSSYRAGFEVRTYRRIQRLLFFHNFPAEPTAGADLLVRSLDFSYADQQAPQDPASPEYSLLATVTMVSYRQGEQGLVVASMPPLEFGYSVPRIEPDVLTLDADSLAGLPAGLDAAGQVWIDLDGEGLAGVLADAGQGWYYKRNLSAANLLVRPDGSLAARAKLGPAQAVDVLPSRSDLSGIRLLDLSGSGRVDVVALANPDPGFFRRNGDCGFDPFQTFEELASIDWSDQNVKLIDLTGDGLADALATQEGTYTFYAGRGEAGFDSARLVGTGWDEERGPAVVLSDGSQTIFTADMSGDGLTDIVRVRNGEACYWPNLGYGRFGARVVMDGAPRFGDEPRFDPRRVRLADIDGTGTADLLYIGADGVTVWFNQSGNSWSQPNRIAVFPSADILSTVNVVDLLGTGTACLTWSSPLPGRASAPLAYVDLMGGRKPHLMTSARNNLGAETRVSYAPSTRFYLEDAAAGQPWVTRLPFPVQVVERVETIDWIGRSRLVTRYAYHHGYFDGREREFRGFGLVEQRDADEFRADTQFADGDLVDWDAQSWSPPTLTRTWFHTGAFAEAAAIRARQEAEFWTEPHLRAPGREADAAAMRLDPTPIPEGMSAAEIAEAYRALKGKALRVEVFGEDSSPGAGNPYVVTEQNYAIACVQHRGQPPGAHAVFDVRPRESASLHYERAGGDPCVTHEVVLACDDYGNVLRGVSAGYPRRPGYAPPEPALSADFQAMLGYDQGRLRVTGTERRYTSPVDDVATWPDDYRAPLPAATDTAEVTGIAPAPKGTGITSRFSFDELAGPGGLWDVAWSGAHDLPYEQIPASDVDGTGDPSPGPARRLMASERTRYRSDDLSALLPVGHLEPLALPGESYQARLTPGLLAGIFGPLVTAATLAEGGYVQLGGESGWWAPGGLVFFSPGDGDTPATELAFACAHFFLPCRATDSLGAVSRVGYDGHALLPAAVTDPVGNVMTVENDYRVLMPATVTDPNGNRVSAAFDVHGHVSATAVMGKATQALGDLLAGFTADLDDATLAAQLADPLADPAAIIGSATTRSLYDVGAYQRTAASAQPAPTVVYTLSRQTHVSELAAPPYPGAPTTTGYQFALSYHDGLGRQIQLKAHVPPGPIDEGGPQVSPRWAGSGWTILDNKGRPVRTYEPFFSATSAFEFAAATGVAVTNCYDPPGRVVAMLHPDASWEKTVRTPWREELWDRDDTVAIADPRTDPDVGGYLSRVLGSGSFTSWYDQRIGGGYGPTPADQSAQQDAAVKAATAAATPLARHRDCLGRPCLTVADNGAGSRLATRTALDAAGRPLAVTDPLGRRSEERCLRTTAAGAPYLAGADLAGEPLYHISAEAGARRGLGNVAGHQIRAWDARGHAFRLRYDLARRPTHRYVATGGGESLVELSVYGEGQPDANLAGRLFRHYDAVGYLENSQYDYKGNLLASVRQLAAAYRDAADWIPLDGLTTAADLDAAATTAGLLPTGDGGRDTFTGTAIFDALNRPVQIVAPHSPAMRPDVLQLGYDEAGRLRSTDMWLQRASAPAALLDPATADQHVVTGIDYNARGQRVAISYGNAVASAYDYDPQTFRLAHLRTTRPASFSSDQRTVQALAYYYDPAGNVTRITDSADTQDVIFFKNQRVSPSCDYSYDPTYRLVSATGREHLGQAGAGLAAPQQVTNDDSARVGLPQPGDGQAMGRYTETYSYDEAGNLLAVAHAVSSGGWTRRYSYAEPSLITAGQTGNRLSATSLPGDPPGGPYGGGYSCDQHGNMTAMPHLPALTWDADDRLRSTARMAAAGGSTPQTAWYAHDSQGQRIRKVTDRQVPAGQAPTRQAERIYLGTIEVYREYAPDGVTVTLERQSLRVADGDSAIALIETRTAGQDPGLAQSVRFQHGNHLGSAVLELSDAAQIISYEEYFPYGSTSYQAVAGQVEVPKRYRYAGKERDAESDLYYNGARYYAPWLGRWTSCDPAGLAGGANLYGYAAGNPVRFTDPTGRDPDDDEAPGSDPPLGTSERFTRHLFVPPRLRLTLNPANFLYSSQSQGSGVMPSGAVDVEAGGTAILSPRLTAPSLARPAFGWGLSQGAIAARYQPPLLPGFDIGAAVTGNLTTQPGSTSGSIAGLLTLHYGKQGLGSTPLIAALYLATGILYTGQTGAPGATGGVVSITPAFGVEFDPPTRPFRLAEPPPSRYQPFFSSAILNPVFAYASTGSLSQGPLLRDLYSAGGILSAGVGFGKVLGLTGEVSVIYATGSAIPPSDQAAHSLTERAGLILTYNYLDRTTSGPQTSSIAFGVWYAHEAGTITGTSTAGSRTGDYESHSIIFGPIFGYRRTPLPTPSY